MHARSRQPYALRDVRTSGLAQCLKYISKFQFRNTQLRFIFWCHGRREPRSQGKTSNKRKANFLASGAPDVAVHIVGRTKTTLYRASERRPLYSPRARTSYEVGGTKLQREEGFKKKRRRDEFSFSSNMRIHFS